MIVLLAGVCGDGALPANLPTVEAAEGVLVALSKSGWTLTATMPGTEGIQRVIDEHLATR